MYLCILCDEEEDNYAVNLSLAYKVFIGGRWGDDADKEQRYFYGVYSPVTDTAVERYIQVAFSHAGEARRFLDMLMQGTVDHYTVSATRVRLCGRW